MVEEMYLEETKDQNNNESNNPKDNTNRTSKELNKDANNNNNIDASAGAHEESGSMNNIMRSSFDQTFNNNNNQTTTSSLNDIVSNNNNPPLGIMDIEMKPRFVKDGYNNNPLLSEESGYGGFSMQDIGRFNVSNVSEQHSLAPRFHGNGVSLTLGLPHHSDNLSLSATQHGFLSPHNIHLGTSNATELCAINAAAATGGPPPPSSHSGAGTGYENIDIQNRKSFATQLLQDFVT